MFFDIYAEAFTPSNYRLNCLEIEAEKRAYIRKEYMKEGAGYVLLGIAIIAFYLTLFHFMGMGGNAVHAVEKDTPETYISEYKDGQTFQANGNTYEFKTYQPGEYWTTTIRGKKFVRPIKENGVNYIPIVDNENVMQNTIEMIKRGEI